MEDHQPFDNNFLFALGQINEGHFVNELEQHLRELANAVATHEMGGKLTVTLALKPAGKRSGGAVTLEARSKLDLPKPDSASKVFFVNLDTAELVLDNPAQLKMPFRQQQENTEL